MGEAFDREVGEMKRLARHLVKYVKTPEDEADICVLKTRPMEVDGYSLRVYYGIDPRPACDLHTVRVTPRDVPFLPFRLHCRRVAAAFLGNDHLALSEFMFLGGKMYVWSVGRSRETGDAVPILLHPHARPIVTEGVPYQAAPVTRFSVPLPG